MKTTFLVRDGLSQVVLHPETRAERAVLDLLDGDHKVVVHRAQFSETHGGYVREFEGRRRFSSFDPPQHLPDAVLVLRPAERPDVEPPPGATDLCKLRDGTWVYRNHAGTWQTCPPPFPPATASFPPDDVNTYFRKTADDTWQVYDRQSRVWHPTTGLPGADERCTQTEVERLTETLRLIRDQYVVNRGDMSDGAALQAIKKICTEVLGE